MARCSVSTLTGWSLTRNSKCWLPLGLPVSRFGNISFLPSIDRILSCKGDTKEWTTKKWSKNGTKDGTYRTKKHVLPDVRDGRDIYEDPGASVVIYPSM